MILQHFNPSTLKVSYNPATKKTQMFVTCANCRPVCNLGYEDGNLNACEFGKKVPTSLCATIYGMRRCSDNSTIAAQSVCLDHECNAFGAGCHGTTVTVLYRTGQNCTFDQDAHIYDATDAWFVWVGPGGPCSGVVNELVIGDCGNNTTVYECDATPLTRNVVAYGGVIDICDPNTGDIW